MIRLILGAAVFAALLFVRTPVALAQDVTLSSRDGAITLSGTLLSFDGEFYELDTVYGRLVLDGQGVRCSGTGCPALADYVARFSFAGAPAMGEVLLPALLENFAQRRGLVARRVAQSDQRFSYQLRAADSGDLAAEIGFRLHSTSEGFAEMLTGAADIAMAMRELRPEEAALLREAGLGEVASPRQTRIVALDGLVPIVAPGGPLTRLQLTDLTGLLSGEIADWPGERGPVTLHGLGPDAGLGQAVADRLLVPIGKAPGAVSRQHASAKALADAVARDPFGFAVTRYSETGSAVPLALVDNCGFALPLTRQALKAEDYPFTAPLFLYLPSQRLPRLAREFLRYLDTPDAQQVIRRAGFIDQGREQIALADQGERLANAIARMGEELPAPELQRMVKTLRGATRLTSTFRFRGGSSELDAQSAGNIAVLAEAIARGEFAGRQLMFVGFSDGEGGWQANRRIAEERAEAVRKAVRKAILTPGENRTKLRVEAFGEALPMACDDTDWGRHTNRRVEVWLQ